MAFPLDRFYHRGHTWARAGSGRHRDGRAGRTRHRVSLGSAGCRGRCRRARRAASKSTARRSASASASADVRVLSPVDGEVVETGGPGCGWYLRVRPDGYRRARLPPPAARRRSSPVADARNGTSATGALRRKARLPPWPMAACRSRTSPPAIRRPTGTPSAARCSWSREGLRRARVVAARRRAQRIGRIVRYALPLRASGPATQANLFSTIRSFLVDKHCLSGYFMASAVNN